MFKKYNLMFSYMKEIKKHLPQIEQYFFENSANFPYKLKSIKLDNTFRIYTVLNFPVKTTKNIQTYGHMFLDNETEKFIKELNNQLKKFGLYELVGLSRADRIGENNILIVVEYKYVNIASLYKKILFGIFAIIGLLILL